MEEQPALPLTRRGRPIARPQPVKEHKIHIAVVDHLNVRGAPDWSFNHPAGGELRAKKTAAKLKAMGLAPGRPDLELISPDGRYYGLELKRPGMTLNENQKAFKAQCDRLGWPYAVAWSVDEACAILEGWGALRRDLNAGRAA